ncbi:secondary carrier transporter [Lithospermum erythrorhizon]|uniref:Secondary carrier transporter n=1 Tax=Lithospermum erythrorhizon TaxID=34254 RepID=A0AAV3RT56_LITER
MSRKTEKIAVASLSATLAETTTFPIDLLKTRLQLHGESTPISSPQIISQVLKNEGILGLYKGLSPAIVRHLFYTPIRIIGYEYLRNASQPSDHGSLSLVRKGLIGGVSGVIAQVVASPADLVKVRMQADGRLASQGSSPRYTGFNDTLNKIVRTEGLGGLWKGVVPNAQRAFLVNMGELACYDHAKSFIIRNKISNDNIYAHTLSSIMSGLAATTLSCPADVIKTRMMNQISDRNGCVKYKSSYDCLVKTVKFEGLRALRKGFFPTWARLGPWQFVFWVSYERIRQIAGLDSF